MRILSKVSAIVLAAMALTISMMLIASTAAYAQTAGQLVQPNYAPIVKRKPGGGLVIPGSTGLKAPAGADKLFVTPSGLDIIGGLPEMAEKTAVIKEPFRNKKVSAAALFSAANALESAYVRAGYPLIRVSMPPQTVANGEALKLIVTEGYIENVNTSWLPVNAQKRVRAIMAPLIGKKNPTSAEIERRLLLAGDTPGLNMTSTLVAGSKPGATVLELSGPYTYPVTGYIGLDNSLSEALGTYTLSLGLNFNNLLGLGEVAYLRLGGWPGFAADNLFAENPRNRQIVAGVTLPMGTNGMWLNLEGVDSRTQSRTELAYNIPDHYQRFSSNIGYDWLRSRSANTSTIIGFDVVSEAQTFESNVQTVPFAQDKLRILRFTQKGDIYFPSESHLTGSATLSFGLDGLGAYTPTQSLPMSRHGAHPDFQKLKINGTYLQPLGGLFNLSISGQAQTSFGAVLPSSEQMGIDGSAWLSAFTTGDIEADTGAALRAELGYPINFQPFKRYGGFAMVASPYMFAAGGIAQLEKATALENGLTRASALGLGVRFYAAEENNPYASTLILEYAHGTQNNGSDANRFNLSFQIQF